MKYESALSLKKQIIRQKAVTASGIAASGLGLRGIAPKKKSPPQLALGIIGSKNKFKIAIRIQKQSALLSSFIHDIHRKAKGEVDIRIVGDVHTQAPWHRKRNRPLQIGGSIGHHSTATGTLGCFVTDGNDDLVLSNNHVLANENKARKGDKIIQPGRADGGRSPSDVVGTLEDFIKVSKSGTNLVDCATAALDDGTEFFFNHLESLGPLRGIRTSPLNHGETVFKVGRTTGVTEGKISAIEVDRLLVGFDMGDLVFDNQIEIEPVGSEPFSRGGDSGSLIVDSSRRAVGLLFAGNDIDATFANPIRTVLDKLNVSLVF